MANDAYSLDHTLHWFFDAMTIYIDQLRADHHIVGSRLIVDADRVGSVIINTPPLSTDVGDDKIAKDVARRTTRGICAILGEKETVLPGVADLHVVEEIVMCINHEDTNRAIASDDGVTDGVVLKIEIKGEARRNIVMEI